MKRRPAIAVIGAGDASTAVRKLAFQVGREIALSGATLVCGGLGGVMEAAAKGAHESNGHTLGILPGYDVDSANPYIEFAVASGMGEARNAIVVGSADAVVALAGEGGTLAEIGFAIKLKRPLVTLAAWEHLTGLHRAATAHEAVELALRLAHAAHRQR